MGRGALAAALNALAGAVAVSGCAPMRAFDVHVGGTGGQSAPCTAQVDGRKILLAEFPAFARRWHGRTAHLTLEPGAAFRCFGAAILELQRAGIGRIGFISEPTETDNRGNISDQ